MRRTPALLVLLLSLAVAAASTVGVPTATAAPGSAPLASQARATGAPTDNYVPNARAYFSYPNRTEAAKVVIRKRVLRTIRSTWGGPRTSGGMAGARNGTIRIATWSFKDWAVARSLVAAHNRGVSVQVVAAKRANQGSGPWTYLRKHLGTRLYRPGNPKTRETISFARACRGACRGPGGTAHAKYFLFDRVGASRARSITYNTSMNLTRFAYTKQWNQAQVMRSAGVYNDFMSVFRQARVGRSVASPYHVRTLGGVTDYFFPRPRSKAAQDPVMQILNVTACKGATAGGNSMGRTRIRIIQYAMYGDRGVWIAKKLRRLWNRGCDIKIIYGVTSRPVLQVLRNGSGRGKVPMRQSVIKNGSGQIVKYNHSKWMTITGRWLTSRSAYVTFTGSANWSLLAFGSDEQMQRIGSRAQAALYQQAFVQTWGQKSSKRPPGGRLASFGRGVSIPGVPEDAPTWGKGAYRYMTP